MSAFDHEASQEVTQHRILRLYLPLCGQSCANDKDLFYRAIYEFGYIGNRLNALYVIYWKYKPTKITTFEVKIIAE
ncbi:hypothetical protein ABD76_09785 [Paenibacillus dendritiformis]|nr:hypothetical protein [Paenibacillus dendritiformis]